MTQVFKISPDLSFAFERIVDHLLRDRGERDEKGRLLFPIIDSIHYPDSMSNEQLAAVHLLHTGKCSKSAARILLGTTNYRIEKLMRRVGWFQRHLAIRNYRVTTGICVEDTPELARRAMEAGLIHTEQGDLRRALLAARVNPSNWLVALAVHPTEGPIAVMIENIETSFSYPRLFTCRENEIDEGFTRYIEGKLSIVLETQFKDKRDALKLLQYLAPLRHQPTA